MPTCWFRCTWVKIFPIPASVILSLTSVVNGYLNEQIAYTLNPKQLTNSNIHNENVFHIHLQNQKTLQTMQRQCCKVGELVQIKTCKCNSGNKSTQRNNTALTTTSESTYENITTVKRAFCTIFIVIKVYLISYTKLNDNVRLQAFISRCTSRSNPKNISPKLHIYL